VIVIAVSKIAEASGERACRVEETDNGG